MESQQNTQANIAGYTRFVIAFVAFTASLVLMGVSFSYEGFTAGAIFFGAIILSSLAFGVPMIGDRASRHPAGAHGIADAEDASATH